MSGGQDWAAEMIDTTLHTSDKLRLHADAVKWHDGEQWQVGHPLAHADGTLVTLGDRLLVVCFGEVYRVSRQMISHYPQRTTWENE